MILFDIVFYLIAAVILVSTGLAITRLNAVHAVCYLVISFLATAMLFYLLGAPLLAALEVILYAGGIMVLFLFVIMMIRGQGSQRGIASVVHQWLPALLLTGFGVFLAGLFLFADPGTWVQPPAVAAAPREFGLALFRDYWLPMEVASLLLLVALIGAFYLGRHADSKGDSQRDIS
ncbi:MAG TPA: NADH-ubiquinone/plastoquinone oxidoreductase subunit 6 [Syntrophobacteraceae bacterium]|jgi:NADH-quinone oxidoreductase subunit J|nr:NADH-ubiquinone/plastoquinone oxidoreductase subunit 6 [Syntrophobacteraceae bacterium]HBD09097.1 NADH-ubiquinone/plastoquinone oxidoreductase subunit 6 [Syntrophobacteraceae bacterium]